MKHDLKKIIRKLQKKEDSLKDYTHETLMVGDVPINFLTDIDFGSFRICDFFDRTEEKSKLTFLLGKGDNPGICITDDYNKIFMTIENEGLKRNFQTFYFRTLISYLASLNSSDYDLIHGCGLVLGNEYKKGALFIGQSGTGKSTIKNMYDQFPYFNEKNQIVEGENSETVIDDDQIFKNNGSMHSCGNLSGVTIEDMYGKDVVYTSAGPKEHPIDVVFVLDNQSLEGGKYIEVPPIIPRHIACIDNLPEEILIPYLDQDPIDVNVPVYLLGTKGSPEKTKSTIDTLVAKI